MHGWEDEHGGHHLKVSRALQLYICVQRAAGEYDFVSVHIFTAGFWSSTGAPVHAVLLAGCSPFAPHPVTACCLIQDTSHSSIAYRTVTVTQRCSVKNCRRILFCCDLHRVACHHKALADTIDTVSSIHRFSEIISYSNNSIFFLQRLIRQQQALIG